jgi:hypothetical protein
MAQTTQGVEWNLVIIADTLSTGASASKLTTRRRTTGHGLAAHGRWPRDRVPIEPRCSPSVQVEQSFRVSLHSRNRYLTDTWQVKACRTTRSSPLQRVVRCALWDPPTASGDPVIEVAELAGLQSETYATRCCVVDRRRTSSKEVTVWPVIPRRKPDAGLAEGRLRRSGRVRISSYFRSL